MLPLRTLSGIGVAAAGVLAVAALVSQRPPTDANPSGGAGPAPQVQFLWSVPATPTNGAPALRPQIASSGSEADNEAPPVRHARRHHAAPREHHTAKHHHRHGESAHISLTGSDVLAAPAAAAKPINERELSVVKHRLKDSLSSELYKDFELFLYVSKAASGPLAQHMYVFRKAPVGNFDVLYDWPVSTGRERVEHNYQGLELSSFTPAGYYKLDPHRFYLHHMSTQWRQPMPFAMFFDWVQRGTPTGLAIHAATGNDIAVLGTRASAGCIRLAPEAAEALYTLIRTQYRGLTPRFAVDHRTGTMSNDGIVLHDADGKARLTDGYRVLVVIENYGGANLVAAM